MALTHFGPRPTRHEKCRRGFSYLLRRQSGSDENNEIQDMMTDRVVDIRVADNEAPTEKNPTLKQKSQQRNSKKRFRLTAGERSIEYRCPPS